MMPGAYQAGEAGCWCSLGHTNRPISLAHWKLHVLGKSESPTPTFSKREKLV